VSPLKIKIPCKNMPEKPTNATIGERKTNKMHSNNHIQY
jgi:hypothetical protein